MCQKWNNMMLFCCLVCQLDLPLSLVFYKWLLGLESTLTLSDLHHVDPVLAASLQQLHDVVIQKQNLEADTSHVSCFFIKLSSMHNSNACMIFMQVNVIQGLLASES